MASTVGVIGAGNIGRGMAAIALRAGHRVVIANSRGPESLIDVVASLGDGATAGTVAEASAAPIVVLAVPWDRIERAVEGVQWDGQVLIDTTNPILLSFVDGTPEISFVDLEGRASSEIVAEFVPGARLVKGGNTLPAAWLAEDPGQDGGRRVMFIAGGDAAAKGIAGAFFEGAGFRAIDVGELDAGGLLLQPPGGTLATRKIAEIAGPQDAGE